MKNKSVHNVMLDMFEGTSSLTKQMTIEEAEAHFSVVMEWAGSEPIPFGGLNSEWQRLKQKMKPDDQLWEYVFQFPRGDGIRGIKLVRQGAVVETIGAVSIPQTGGKTKKKLSVKTTAGRDTEANKPGERSTTVANDLKTKASEAGGVISESASSPEKASRPKTKKMTSSKKTANLKASKKRN